jgi:cytochrome b561
MPLRLYWAISKDRPPHFTKYTFQKIVSTGTHVGLHAGLVFMSFTGFLMLLIAGEPWPFFLGSVPNPKPFGIKKELSNKIREIHKSFGVLWAWLVPAHILGVGFHVLQGERILRRMNPFI